MKLAIRRLSATPTFTTASVATLALAVAALTAAFGVAEAVLLRPLPYPESDRLVDVGYAVPGYGFDELPFSVGTFVHTRDAQRSFSHLAIVYDSDRYNVGLVDPERVPVARVTPGFFEVFSSPPAVGRPFVDDDAVPGAAPVVIVSHDLWRRRWGEDPGLVGRSIHVEGVERQVVGIASEGFRFPDRRTGLWVPFTIDPGNLMPMAFGYPGVARLAPGVTLEAAREDVRRITQGLPDVFPGRLTPEWAERGGFVSRVRPLKDRVVGSVADETWLVFGTAALLLLLAVANLANLFLVRLEGRSREFAVRRALGSGRTRLMLLPLGEGLAVGVAGAALGLGLATLGMELVTRLAPPDLPRVDEVGLGPGAVAFGAALAVGAGSLLSLLPLLAGRSRSVQDVLRTGGATTPSRATRRLQDILVANQAALAVALLVGAGLLLRSARNLAAVDPGFSAEGLVTFELGLPDGEYGAEDRPRTWQLLQDQLEGVASVTAVGGGEFPPFTPDFRKGPLHEEGEDLPEGQSGPVVDLNRVTPGFLGAMGIEVVEGRGLERGDGPGGYPAVVVNQTLVRRHLGEGSALGRRIRITPRGEYFEIVGVVEDARTLSMGDAPIPFVYLPPGATTPSAPDVPTSMTFAVRTDEPLDRVLPALAGAVAAVDPKLPLGSVRTMGSAVADDLARQRLVTGVLLAMAATGLLLAAVGVYGVVAYVVVRRRKDVGVRVALGARPRRVLLEIARRALLVVLAGAAAGALVAVYASRFLAGVVYGIAPRDPTTYAGAVALVMVVAGAASLRPAWRASRTDAAEVLREG